MNALPVSLLSLLLLAPRVDGWLGVYLDPERDEPVITEVIPGSPAARAGLEAGDLLLAVDGQPTATRDEFVAAIRAHQAGDRLSLKVRRGDRESVVVVKLGERPEAATAPIEPAPPEKPRKTRPPQPAVETAPALPQTQDRTAVPLRRAYLGLSVREADGGVVVDRVLPLGPAEAIGVAPGERVVSIGDQIVSSLADLDRFLGRARPGHKVAIGLQSPSGSRSLTLTIGERPATLDDGGPVSRGEAPPVPEPVQKQPAGPGHAEAKSPADLEAEIEALRRELHELRRQLEELRKHGGGE